jgi:hypothetical protein
MARRSGELSRSSTRVAALDGRWPLTGVWAAHTRSRDGFSAKQGFDGRRNHWRGDVRALEAQPLASVVDKYPVGPQEMLADVAALYVGTTESLDNRMGNDARLREIFEADDLVKNGWHNGRLRLVLRLRFGLHPAPVRDEPMFPTVSAPRVASVHVFRTRWAPEQGCLIFPPSAPPAPHKGDVVVFTFSHIGIVESTGPGAIQTIEGNTNEQGSREGTTCRRKQRALAQIPVLHRNARGGQYLLSGFRHYLSRTSAPTRRPAAGAPPAGGGPNFPRDAGGVTAAEGRPHRMRARGTHAAHEKTKSRLKPFSAANLVDTIATDSNRGGD